MSEDKTKMVGMYVFVADWISGTRHLTLQQRGIYWDLLAFSQTFNGRGLPNDINELCRLILPFEPNIEKAEDLRSDLINVINSKFQLVDNRFYNERQHKEFLKSKELSITRSRARKSKKFDTVLLEQNANNTYKYNYKDNNKYITNINIEEIFNDNVWSRLKYRKGSKQKAFEKYLKIKDNVNFPLNVCYYKKNKNIIFKKKEKTISKEKIVIENEELLFYERLLFSNK